MAFEHSSIFSDNEARDSSRQINGHVRLGSHEQPVFLTANFYMSGPMMMPVYTDRDEVLRLSRELYEEKQKNNWLETRVVELEGRLRSQRKRRESLIEEVESLEDELKSLKEELRKDLDQIKELCTRTDGEIKTPISCPPSLCGSLVQTPQRIPRNILLKAYPLWNPGSFKHKKLAKKD